MAGADASAKRARIARVDAEACRVERTARAWLSRRRKLDREQRHQRQLDVLQSAVLGATARIAGGAQLSLDATSGALYRAAAAQERRLALVDRVFGYFQSRFDQRDSEPLGALLGAADDVIRSLYVQPFRASGAPPPAAPLAYVERAFSPHAVPRDTPPADLTTADDLLRAALDRLPFGVVGLPPWIEEGPWTLVYLAHEIGHHVHFDLAPGAALVKAGINLMQQVADGARLGDAGRGFAVWSKEIFADAFSVAALGPVAVEAIAELERGDDAAMLAPNTPKYPYPCPAVRLALMSAFAQKIGLDASAALGEIDPDRIAGKDPAQRTDEQRKAAAQLGAVPAIVAALAGWPLAADKTLSQLCDVRSADFAPDGEIAAWAGALAAGKKRPKNATLRGTRHVLAATWVAWRQLCAIDDDGARGAAIDALRAAAIDALRESREPVTLSKGPVGSGLESSPAFGEVGKDLGDFLLARTPEELGL